MAKKPCVVLALVMLLGVQSPAQQFPPGFVDPAPLQAAAAKDIGESIPWQAVFAGHDARVRGDAARVRDDRCGAHERRSPCRGDPGAHGHSLALCSEEAPRSERTSWRSSRAGYWKQTIEGNRRRDRRNFQRLRRQGWLVIRVWEHEVECDAEGYIEHIQAAIRLRMSIRS